MLIFLLLIFNQEQFDNYIENDRIVIVKFIDEPIPALNRTIVKALIRRYSVIIMQDNKRQLKVKGTPFLGIFSKDTKVLFYGKYN